MGLEHLEPITQLTPLTRRVLGCNPGKFTLQGTNTYLLGSSSPYILIDTGEGSSSYPPLLASVLDLDSPQATICDVIITHRHKDHWGGLKDVVELIRKRGGRKPRVWKWPESEEVDEEIARSMGGEGNVELDGGGRRLWRIDQGRVFWGEGGVELRVLHTPGHTADSICLEMTEEDGSTSIYTADTVLGGSSAVFTDLSTYLASLNSLLSLKPTTLFPGHGPVVKDGTKAIQAYISHRQSREDEIVKLLEADPRAAGGEFPGGFRSGGGSGGWSSEALVLEMYPSLGIVLQTAASRGVDLHLAKLEKEGKVKRIIGSSGEEWVLVR